MTTRIVEIRRGILKKNDELAAGLRSRFTAAGVLVLNIVSSPGTGKTALLEVTLRELRSRGARVAALVGDLETDNDARRLASSGAPVRQINTHGICHLDAEMIGKHIDEWRTLDLGALDYLFIENVILYAHRATISGNTSVSFFSVSRRAKTSRLSTQACSIRLTRQS